MKVGFGGMRQHQNIQKTMKPKVTMRPTIRPIVAPEDSPILGGVLLRACRLLLKKP
jgi:hypothetical protein